MKIPLPLIAVAVLQASCVHEFPYLEKNVDGNTIVVEGFITNEYINHTIKISRLSHYSDTVRNAVSKAYVAVTSNDSTYYFREVSDGIYESSNKFVGIVGNVYYLHIELGDSIVLSAQSSMMPVTPPDKITYKHLANGMLSIQHIAESFVPENPAKYIINLRWKDPGSEEQRIANLYYYSLTTVDISQLFAPKVEETIFPKGAILIERKYSIDKDYEVYLRSLLAETLWSGGYFDEAHGNLHTNITTTAKGINTAGYFSANTVYIDTLMAY
ncbi:MAG: DUF4249 family protein [Bacteroidales bacterium]|nr:DUF4249 family protein [Bacteroidales bacterium]